MANPADSVTPINTTTNASVGRQTAGHRGSEGRSSRTSNPVPLGVSAGAAGLLAGEVNVAVFAPEVSALDIHFEDADGRWGAALLPELIDGVHHGIVRGLLPGSRYAFWPHGKALPDGGAGQLLLDPYGRAIDDDGGIFRSVHVDAGFDWAGDTAPEVPWRDMVVYECHVKGQTKLHPEIPEALRGTYAGLAHPVMLEYFKNLGITSVQLLPVHFHIDEPHLQELGLSNYWGYNTLGFFAPHARYATRAARAAGPKAVQDEFKSMVKSLHEAGLEVILDVVYNHTAEGGKHQQTYSFRGLGDEVYYRHDDHGNYLDTTGCGNTLDLNEPQVLALVLDSLRYWVQEFHIDGFRFDLAVSLCRDPDGHFNPRHPFLRATAEDPTLSEVKLISEPWDVAPGGWQTGNFPAGWADWNDRFRDTVRDFWLGDQHAIRQGMPGGSVARLASRLAGSADVFAGSGRSSLASVNFITAHDGFTLADLTSYDRKHNEDNGEENRDGTNHNRSYNHGVEGPTGDAAVLDARARSARNLMATLLLSLGVPMITAGDELGKTQHGNNNAYCQDNELSWLNWVLDDRQEQMFKITRRLLRIRQSFLTSQPRSYPTREQSSYLLWFNEAGEPMTQEQWTDPGSRTLQLLMGSPDGVIDGLVVINGRCEPRKITMPSTGALKDFGVQAGNNRMFELVLTTSKLDDQRRGAKVRSGEREIIGADALSVYRVWLPGEN